MTLRVVQLTPPARGAIATLRVEGPGAREALAAVVRARSGRALAELPAGRLWLAEADLGLANAEEVVLRPCADGALELNCHGGPAVVERLTAALAACGAEPMAWQDWVAAQEPDPLAASARVALAEARTERAALVLLDQYQGALAEAVVSARAAMARDDAAAAGHIVDELLGRAALGLHLTRPWRVVLAGPVNAGKSSLINALLGYPRAIVDHAPGTTRDVVTATTALGGWPVELADTAGLRSTEEEIERTGVARARAAAASADLVLLVFDRSLPWTAAEESLVRAHGEALVVFNKCDLPEGGGLARPAGLATSAATGAGIETLEAVIAARLVPDSPAPGAAVPFTAEQVEGLQAAAGSLRAGDLAAAERALEPLRARTGEQVSRRSP